ncbi:Tyrosine- phosphatase non-receptor type 4 [Paramuricea clavata]|uniref:Tyrosine- phosphatase non-receptor type 4, partial n=2 Tax=Paramuricea clavata TaxID=317549 RepID=A0A7D9EWN0_PARCT|nr:Tyrosine- phosphatase non-receptor type 4 [Paramuricea clavata]
MYSIMQRKYLFMAIYHFSIQPNKNGQFGLNFKGGAEQKLKPIITQIAPNSPASICDPQLQEGDEIVYINGRKAEQLSHEQICCLIRSIGQSATNKTLTLSVRPFGSIENHEIKNSEMKNSPNHGISSQLLTSMAQIKQGLENGDLLAFYVDMPKKKLELSTEIAHFPENKTKNRYRDILPYDFNRVVISGENDYINASHVQTDIGYSGMVNEYLAAQGPLSDTCGDFWQMIWDQEVSLVVMLTTTMENGKTKCHRYWPECGEHFEIGNFEVSPISSRDYSPAYIHRELTVTDLETDEERTIQHLQYTAWPDHGVPEDSRRFLTFVNEVRRYRSASSAPVVIHCSAGVGRTGVFITVETACCLIEAGVAVYPEQMLDTLRDQRPSLIQTPGQFKFTCETILDIYQDHFLKTQSMNGR